MWYTWHLNPACGLLVQKFFLILPQVFWDQYACTFFKTMYLAYLVFRWDVSSASGNLSSPSLHPGILFLLSQSVFEHSLDAACPDFIGTHEHPLPAQKPLCGKWGNGCLYGVEPQPCESRRGWQCARRAVIPQADAGLMFAQSPAARAAEDQVKALQSELPRVRLCLASRDRNWTQLS